MRLFASMLLTLVTASLLAAQQTAAPDAAAVPPSPQTTTQSQGQVPAPGPGSAVTPGSPDAQANSQVQPANGAVPASPAAPDASASPSQVSPQTPATGQATGTPASSQQPSTNATSGDVSTAPLGTPILPTVTPREAAEAKRQFQAGMKLKSKGHLDAAFGKFSSASELDPRNVNYITAREIMRQALALQALKQGNQAMQKNNEIVAMADFQKALSYDPTNDYATQRLRDAIPQQEAAAKELRVVEQSLPIELQPDPKHQDFHFRGDSRALLTEVARAYGITAEFDDSVKNLHLHYDIQDVNFATAMLAANAVTKTFWITLSPKQIYLLADTVDNRRNFERMGLRTFYLPDLNDQQLTEMSNSLRVLLNLRFISVNKSESAIVIRAELPVLDAADKLIRSLTTGRPEVLLDMRVFAISTNFARALGTALPTQFTMFNISPALLGGLGASASNLINQLIASGGINQANSSAVSALLGQLANSASSSPLAQPFVIFGGGLTLFGLGTGGQGVTPTGSLNTSDIRELEHVTLRASHNDPATMKIGERYPIINATFAPIYNSSAISSVIGNSSYIAPVPSINYEDIGLILKATPLINGDESVSMKLELQMRSLGASMNNGIPIINNREYNGNITVKSGESSVITGMIEMNDSLSISGYPFLGQIPGLGYLATTHTKNITQDELLVVITPHVLRQAEHNSFAVELPPSH